MGVSYIIIFLCINYSFANIEIPVFKNSSENGIYCAIEIANENFNFQKPTVILSKDVEGKIVNMFLENYNGIVVVEAIKDGPSPGQVVIIVESFKSFMKVLLKLQPDLKGKTFLSNGAKFLIILDASPQKIKRITTILWNFHAANAIIVITHNQRVIEMYTYFPYKNNFDCQNTEPILIGYWIGKEKPLPKNLYSDKTANMNGCPLYISTNKLYHPATEQKIPLQMTKKAMIRLLRDKINFTPIISIRDYVSIDSDRAKNWSDSLNDVITGLANISTCSIPLGIDRLGLLDYSVPYFRVRLAWMAPPVKPGPIWWRLLSPLNGYLWLVLLIVVFLVTSLPFMLKLKAVKKFCYRYFKNIDKVRGVAIRVWGVMLGQPIRVAPRRFRDFYIISLWVWFTFVVRSAYQSVLIGALKTDTFIGDFVDLKETIDNGYRFGGRQGILGHFEHDPVISEGFEIIPESKFEVIFHDVIEGRRNFVIATSLEYSWAYCLAQGRKEDDCGHVLPDSIITVPLVIWMKMNSPFQKPLEVWLPRLIESGLLEDKHSIKKPLCCSPKTIDPTPLTRHQTFSCFICLLLGYIISATVFTIEILRCYKGKR